MSRARLVFECGVVMSMTCGRMEVMDDYFLR